MGRRAAQVNRPQDHVAISALLGFVFLIAIGAIIFGIVVMIARMQ